MQNIHLSVNIGFDAICEINKTCIMQVMNNLLSKEKDDKTQRRIGSGTAAVVNRVALRH